MELDLKGKRAIVTGGSRGIGRAVAEHLLAEGVDVAICARDKDAVDRAVAEMTGKGGRIIGGAADVSSPDGFAEWVAAAVADLGGVDIFLANVSVGNGPDKWEAAFAADVMGTVRGCEAVLPHMRSAGGGSIIMISTTAACRPSSTERACAPEPPGDWLLVMPWPVLAFQCAAKARLTARYSCRVGSCGVHPTLLSISTRWPRGFFRRDAVHRSAHAPTEESARRAERYFTPIFVYYTNERPKH